MSKRYVVCVPDSYVDMVNEFMAAQAHKGLSFAVLVSMAVRTYGVNDIIVSSLMGRSAAEPSSIPAVLSEPVFEEPKKKRGRPRKSETSSPKEASVTVEKKEPVTISLEENQKPAPKTEDASPNSVPNISKEEPRAESSSGNESSYNPYQEETKTAKERSGWSDDAFDGIDPDFNPDGGLDNVFELLGGNG